MCRIQSWPSGPKLFCRHEKPGTAIAVSNQLWGSRLG